MTPFRRLLTIPLPAVVALLVGPTGSASAGWDNVFQVTCNDCQRPAISYYAPAPAAPACPPQQKVEYRKRCFYEPITVMKPERYVEEVPTQTKSYYYEPVTSYSYSSYYDPCTCRCQKIAVPRTSYRLREKCNTVMRYVERTRMVAVQSQRQVCETQPVVTYYGAPTRTYYAPSDPATVAPPAPSGPTIEAVPGSPPTVSPEVDRIPMPADPLPTSPGTSLYRSMPPRAVKYNAHTTGRTNSGSVRGEIVLRDTVTPRSGAKLVFVNATDLTRREYVTADGFGNFDARLPVGEWFVYLGSGTGRADFHKKIAVEASDAKEYTIVSR